ncbi:hypothetical protein GGX14DRAFT_695198 [Mycena pura]|uniref:Fungal-type protein kinase domain-containing protein n=1 Tax=Mycena pura TaxID=153505 RepID=A0AAD6YIP3_9AGAR|nr:hypothetical protein GGX14DRAFT_695198 [Mycena pura]
MASKHTESGAGVDVPHTPPRSKSEVDSATPHRTSSHDSEAIYQRVEEIQDAILAELASAWVEEAADLPFQAKLTSIIDATETNLDQRVLKWLRKYSGYDNVTKSWTEIPKTAKLEEDLYDPLVAIMSDILEDFDRTTQTDNGQTDNGQTIKRRLVRNTHNTYMPHNEEDAANKILKSEPDISVFGTGPSATKSANIPEDNRYSHVASLWEVKLESTFGDKQRKQIAAYSRETFIQQPNRIFVYATMLTARDIRVLRFDRAGCYYSRKIDYHANPVFFVKLVLLLSSFDEAILGFDTSIYWENGKRKMKIAPLEIFDKTAKSWEANTRELVFDLDDKPLFSRRTIRSRGTVCWVATYNDEQYIVKDYWRADGRLCESEFLRSLVNIKGVGQMLTYVDDRDSIKLARGLENMISDSGAPVADRSFMRVVVRKYGETLEKATSARHLLCAVRDIVEGHRDSLLELDTLHRDISFNNLLLSLTADDARGVIIDWDMAKRMTDLVREKGRGTDGDLRTGTMAYQSVKKLHGDPRLSHHDHMDDLESIFYVLSFVLFCHDTCGILLDDIGKFASWFNPSSPPIVMADVKKAFLVSIFTQPLSRYVGPEKAILLALMNKLRTFFRMRMDLVDHVFAEDPIPFPAYSVEEAKGDFERFLDHIQQAIETLPPDPPRTSPGPPSPSGSLKRPREADDESTRPQKKGSSNSPAPSSTSGANCSSRVLRRGAQHKLHNYKEPETESDSDTDTSGHTREVSPSPLPASKKARGKARAPATSATRRRGHTASTSSKEGAKRRG